MPVCRGCKMEIKWIITPSGKKMPIDTKQRSFYIIDSDGFPHLFKGHEPHWATCKDRDKFKRK